jgi:hypothetical protein
MVDLNSYVSKGVQYGKANISSGATGSTKSNIGNAVTMKQLYFMYDVEKEELMNL